jgi:hypothetical protein
MLNGFSYREKDPNYNKYEQQFSKEASQADKTKKEVKMSLVLLTFFLKTF